MPAFSGISMERGSGWGFGGGRSLEPRHAIPGWFFPIRGCCSMCCCMLAFRVSQAGVAQRVEQLICNQRVGGSNPFASSTRVRVYEQAR